MTLSPGVVRQLGRLLWLLSGCFMLSLAAVGIMSLERGLRVVQPIEDAALEMCIRYEIGNMKKPLTHQDFSRVSGLRAQPVHALRGLDQCTNLRTLYLSQNLMCSTDYITPAPPRTTLGKQLSWWHHQTLGRLPSNALDPLWKCEKLEELTLDAFDASNLHGLAGLESLRKLSVSAYDQPIDLDSIGEIQSLEELTLSGELPRDLTPLTKLSRLRRLSIWNGINDSAHFRLPDLAQLPLLESLEVGRVDLPADWTGKATALKYLALRGTALTEVPQLSNPSIMSSLDLSDNKIKTMDSVLQMTGLESLSFLNNPVKLHPEIGKLPNLASFSMWNSPAPDANDWITLCRYRTPDMAELRIFASDSMTDEALIAEYFTNTQPTGIYLALENFSYPAKW